MKPVEAVFILAAGRGERLRPLTDSIPKPLLPVRGKPVLYWLLQKIQTLQPKRVVLNAWHLKEQVVQFADSMKREFSFEILVSQEEELLGTGGGLKKALPMINSQEFLMMNGDCLWDGDLRSFVARSQGREGDAIWWLNREDPQQTVISVDRGKIVGIGKVWSQGTGDKRGCFSGIQWIRDIAAKELPDNGCIVRNYWVNRLNSGHSLLGDFEGLKDWTDIGTPERYREIQD